MRYEYRPCYSANIATDDIQIYFYRLHEDVTDIMSDARNKSWEAKDSFIISVKKVRTTRTTERKPQPYPFDHLMTTIESTDVKVLDAMEIRTDSKDAANYIWFLAKHGATFDVIKAMHEAKKF